MKILAILLLLALTGCATVEPQTGAEFPEGAKVPAPWGYYDLCAREPESVFCK